VASYEIRPDLDWKSFHTVQHFSECVVPDCPNCLRCSNYSNADSDSRHNLTANYVWDLPFKSSNKFLNETIGGWTTFVG
jgi:hypothetical protein